MSFGQSKETVCKYYLQGQCRFGTNCRFAHPAGQGPASSSNAGSFKNQTWTAKDARQPSFDAESLRKDFAQGVDRPLYPLSSFGPGKCIPCVIDGLDQSPEELRVAAWTAVREGVGLDSYKAHEKQLIDTAQALINTAASTGAAVTLDESKRIWNAVDERGIPSANGAAEAKSRLRERLQPSTSGPAFGSTPNALAFGTTSAFGASQPAQPSAFGGTSFVKPGTGAFGTSTAASTFGSTSAFGASPQPSAFGAPAQPSAFGSTPTTSAFGQSGFGAKPAFGQSGFGTTAAPTTSAFGSSSTTAATPAFGQSAFGSSTTTAPAFGQSAFGAKPTTSAFGASGTGGGFGAFSGKSSSFGGTGGTTNATPAFGAPASTSAFGSGTGGTSAFGASSGTGSAFGAFATKSTSFGGQPTSAFGSTPAAAGGAFGQPAAATAMDAGMESDTPAQPPAFGQPAVTSAFGQTQPTPSAFGQSQPATASAFGQTSAFGSGGSAFGASKPSAFGSSAPTTSAFGAAPTASAFGGSAFGAPAKPSAFGQPAATSNPFGAKTSAKDRDPYSTLLPPDYETTLSEAIMNAFRADRFELGSIPECVPPLGLR